MKIGVFFLIYITIKKLFICRNFETFLRGWNMNYKTVFTVQRDFDMGSNCLVERISIIELYTKFQGITKHTLHFFLYNFFTSFYSSCEFDGIEHSLEFLFMCSKCGIVAIHSG